VAIGDLPVLQHPAASCVVDAVPVRVKGAGDLLGDVIEVFPETGVAELPAQDLDRSLGSALGDAELLRALLPGSPAVISASLREASLRRWREVQDVGPAIRAVRPAKRSSYHFRGRNGGISSMVNRHSRVGGSCQERTATWRRPWPRGAIARR